MHRIVAALKAYFGRMDVADATVAAYHRALRHCDVERVKAACIEHVQQERYFPAVSQIFDRLVGGTVRLDTGERAWLEVMRAVSRWGRLRPWVFDDPALELAVEAIGKSNICDVDAAGMNTLRAQFIRIYASFVEAERDAAKQAMMLGLPFQSVLAGKVRRNAELAAPAPEGERVGPETIGQALLRALPGHGGGDEPPEAA